MSPSPAIPPLLSRMDRQRTEIFRELADLPMGDLWRRPARGKWSAGEHLDHTRLLLRSALRILHLGWPLLRHRARRKHSLPYPTEFADPFGAPAFPTWLGVLWKPRHHASRPLIVPALHRLVAAQHDSIRRFYEGKPEALLGNAYLYDPVIGRVNLIQALRIGVHHDAHHYRIVRRIVRRGDAPASRSSAEPCRDNPPALEPGSS